MATGAVSTSTITPSPINLLGGICSNVVQSVSITYTLDKSGNIQTPRVVVFVADSVSTLIPTQTDAFTFTFANTPDLADTSSIISTVGNPGYAIGDPLLVLFDGSQELSSTTNSKRGILYPPVTSIS
jgi:Protein of unknown function (DUF1619)